MRHVTHWCSLCRASAGICFKIEAVAVAVAVRVCVCIWIVYYSFIEVQKGDVNMMHRSTRQLLLAARTSARHLLQLYELIPVQAKAAKQLGDAQQVQFINLLNISWFRRSLCDIEEWEQLHSLSE